jgi:hypothetical protein
MGIALHREQFIVLTEVLFEDGNAEGTPQQVAVVAGESRAAFVGERNYGMFEMQPSRSELQQFVYWPCDGRGLKAGRTVVPTLREDAGHLRLLKPPNKNSRSRSRIRRMHELRAYVAAPKPDANNHCDSD